MVERVLGDLVAAVDPVHDLQWAVRPAMRLLGAGLEEVHEG